MHLTKFSQTEYTHLTSTQMKKQSKQHQYCERLEVHLASTSTSTTHAWHVRGTTLLTSEGMGGPMQHILCDHLLSFGSVLMRLVRPSMQTWKPFLLIALEYYIATSLLMDTSGFSFGAT